MGRQEGSLIDLCPGGGDQPLSESAPNDRTLPGGAAPATGHRKNDDLPGLI